MLSCAGYRLQALARARSARVCVADGKRTVLRSESKKQLLSDLLERNPCLGIVCARCAWCVGEGRGSYAVHHGIVLVWFITI